MAVKLSTGLRNQILDGVGYSALAGGFIYIFSDPDGNGIPDVDEAAASADYPLVAKISSTTPADPNGADGLDFDVAANGIMSKDSDTWQAEVAITGGTTPDPAQAPAFARFVAAADVATVRDASTSAVRLQFTLSGPGGNGDALLAQNTYVDEDVLVLDAFQIRQPASL